MMELVVHAWPGPVPALRDGLFVIGVETSALRERAREQIRLAARTALAAVLSVDAGAIAIDSTPGEAPRIKLAGDEHAIGCSFTHEEGYALAAINLHGAVGVDVMRVQDIQDWDNVARDYLGPEVCAALAAAPAGKRAIGFAQAWTRHEAWLKCHGRQLSEWQAGDEASTGIALRGLPEGLVGHLAMAGAN
ncbi:4'-phosphopantetheinyl transferase family protein [Rugamonas aquatica]|uniref:4'-phosphopantetheinyl transferase superfamily protein n=1 Tax=Rugamonas aquatica TaxID=2743357 RepID=A0A6A7N7K9_9BURK|nr:4'-phosphopantetheinyl transferase superfamily protein [Rugamonas aquatica]MQA40898.1 4'-phosphopantetheinyl transferase superfamily protein [Rugamonas aquatica]